MTAAVADAMPAAARAPDAVAPPAAVAASADAEAAAWTRAIAGGDAAAFAAFYATWFPAALRLAQACSRRDEAFCLDVVQDVMLRAARKLPPLPDAARLAQWLATAIGNACRDRLRAANRRAQREQRAGAAAAAVAAEPWHDLLAGEQRAWLVARLAELPAADRALLTARFGEQAVAAAGAMFGLGADAAHGRLRRVLAKLRQQAAEWWQ